MIGFKIIAKYVVLITVLSLSTCASKPGEIRDNAQESREKALLEKREDGAVEKYADLLVDPERYTSSGRVYHEKYRKYLIAIGAELVEDKSLKVSKGSIGFYFDRKSDSRDRLYLGIDLEMGISTSERYQDAAASYADTTLKQVMETVNTCISVFREKNIVGMVIGFKWLRSGNEEHVNIWIVEDDVILFERGKLTLQEVVVRATVTGMTGAIIRLPL